MISFLALLFVTTRLCERIPWGQNGVGSERCRHSLVGSEEAGTWPHGGRAQRRRRAAPDKFAPLSALRSLHFSLRQWQRFHWGVTSEIIDLPLLLLHPASPSAGLNVHLLPPVHQLLLADLHLVGRGEVSWLHLGKGQPLGDCWAGIPLQIIMPASGN